MALQSLPPTLPKAPPRTALPSNSDWQTWLSSLFPEYVTAGFAPRHTEFWGWVWQVRKGKRTKPLVAIWPRGGAKSTSAELAVVALAARRVRSYALYVCETQDQADDHIQNIANLLESPTLEEADPDLANRSLNKYGYSRGYTRQRLSTHSGFTVDAIGLDRSVRGIKRGKQRPDLIIFDDIDSDLDTPGTIEKKIKQISKKLLPSGSADVAVLAVQNLVSADGVFAQLKDGRADFLADRLLSGPYPALDDMAYEQIDGKYVIVAGKPTWQGQNLASCQNLMDTIGLTAFLTECQHEVDAALGGMFGHLDLAAMECDWDETPELVDVQVWCDPAVTNTDKSDCNGVVAGGVGIDERVYVLYSSEQRDTPQGTLRLALMKAVELKASYVGVETDQGGDTWESVYHEAWAGLVKEGLVSPQTPQPLFRAAKAGSEGPKRHRWQQMLTFFERNEVSLIRGTHTVLVRALRRLGIKKPYDLGDALYWLMWGLFTPEEQGQAVMYNKRVVIDDSY